ncbi:SCP-like extracellular protein [Ornithinibacillus sp. L9]|uniref:SCP-like extracellular protein n=2 Tax=Ornithinibacillus caprae TaxID=2678566 RepID=A0A6N8FJ24_9BACI|nr:SCP-like extracellular protein [Ornithinibacillus caprae]
MFIFILTLVACADNNATDNDLFGNNNNNNNGNISSLSTNSPSEDYGQTQPPNQQGQGYGNNFRPIGAQSGDANQPRPGHPDLEQFPAIPQPGQGQGQQGQTPDQNRDQQQEQQQQPQQPQQPQEEERDTDRDGQTQPNYALNEYEQAVVELTNDERRKAGLDILEVDNTLSNVAREKSKDMQANDYFSHTSPTYGSPFDMMSQFGVSYRSAAENIAAGQQSPEEVVRAWMNSEGHRENILNGGFTHIGVGFEDQGNNWTQMFIRK